MQGTQQAAGRAFSSRMVELALSSYPGLYSLGPPQAGSAFGVYWPALVDQELLDHTVHHHDGTSEPIAAGSPPGAGGQLTRQTEPSPAPSVASPWTADELVVASLGEIVHARSGDKGGDANLGVWVRDREAWDWLQATLTVEELRRLLPETSELAITALRTAQPGRGELPHPGTARDRRHLVAAAGCTGKGARRMAALTQHQGAAVVGEDIARHNGSPRSGPTVGWFGGPHGCTALEDVRAPLPLLGRERRGRQAAGVGMGSFYNLPLNAPGIKKARQRETYGSRARRRHGRPVRHLVNGKAERFNDEGRDTWARPDSRSRCQK